MAALRAVIAAVRRSATAAEFGAVFGRTVASDRRPDGLRVEPAGGPFAAFEMRPWTDAVTGVVDIELRPGHDPIPIDALRSEFGPFEEMPRLGSARPWWMAEVGGDGAGILLSVAVVGTGVAEIVLRRDPAMPR